MKPRPNINSRLTIVALTLVCLIVPFCLGYMFYVTSQRSYYTKRNFRVLDSMGTQIRLKIENLTTNLINAVSKAKTEENKTQASLPKRPTLNVEVLRRAVRQVDRYGTNLKLESNPAAASPQKPSSPQQQAPKELDVPPAAPPVEQQAKSAPPAKSVSLRRTGTARGPGPARSAEPAKASDAKPDPLVSMSVKPDKGSFAIFLEYRNSLQAGLPAALQASSDIEKVIRPMVSRYLYDEVKGTNENLFDEVLVAEQSDGRVIFTAGESGIRLVNINSLLPQAGSGEKARLSDGSSTEVDVELAGRAYKFFLQPVQLSIPTSGNTANTGARWVVCGLVSSNHLRDETFTVSYTVVIAFFFLLVMTLLSLPFLKLRLMGARDRLTRGNLWSAALSAVLGISLLTFLLVDSYTYLALSWRLDDQLKQLAGNIQSNFRAELVGGLKQLMQMNDRLLDSSYTDSEAAALVDLKNSIGRTEIPDRGKQPGAASQLSQTSVLGTEVDCLNAPYPFFNSAIWIDPSGQQRIKWTTRSDTSPFISVEDRLYFRNVREGNLWTIGDGPEKTASEYAYFLEPVTSRNTGENVAIVATRVPGSKWAMAMDTRLLSLVQTVLPAGYGYCVINNDGDVLFHSQEVKNLEEQFFEECRNDGLLRSAVLARTGEFVDAKYLGRGHRLYVTPVKDTPWSLVVFRDKQMLRTINLEILTLSFILLLVFGLIMLILVVVLRRVRAEKRSEWLWPDETRGGRHEALVLVNVLLGLVYLPWVLVGRGWILIVTSLLIPAVGIVLFTADGRSRILKTAEAAAARLKFLRMTTSVGYTLSLATLLALISVLPTLAYFKTARDFEMTEFIMHGQMSIAKQLEDRYDRVQHQYSSVKIGSQDELKEKFIAWRRLGATDNPNWDVYCSFFFDTRQTAMADGTFVDSSKPIGSLQWLKWLSPLYDQTSIERHGFSQDASADGSWTSAGTAYTEMSLLRRRRGSATEPGIAVTSRLAPFENMLSGVWWGSMLVYALLLVSLAYLMVQFLGRRLFLLDLDRPRPLPDRKLQSEPIRHNFVLIRSPFANGLGQWPEQNCHVIDMVEVLAEQDSRFAARSIRPGLAIVLDRFEFKMEDPAANCRKLDIVEHFLRQGRKVVIVSATAPANFVLVSTEDNGGSQGRGKETPQGGAPPAARTESGDDQTGDDNGDQFDHNRRWAEAFQTFAVLYGTETHEGQPMDEDQRPFYSALKCPHQLAYLERIRSEMQSDFGAEGPSGSELVNEVADRARPFHQAIWHNCSKDEKLTLIHIALNGLVSFHSKAVRALMKSGLVARDPALRLSDEAFRRFVASRSYEEEFSAWEKEGKRSYWELVKVPLGLVLITVAVFLFVTQKEFYDSTMTFLSAAAVGIAALLRLFGLFQGKPGGSNA